MGRLHACMHVHIDQEVGVHACMPVHTAAVGVRMRGWYACMHACAHGSCRHVRACMHACMHVRMYLVCMHAGMYEHIGKQVVPLLEPK